MGPTKSIKNEHKNGPIIAPKPKANCKPAPAATNFSLGIKSFVCANIKENLWYYFNEEKGGKWEPTEIGHELRKKLSLDIVNIYSYYLIKYLI